MTFKRLEIPDLVLCDPDILGDDRGYFLESFRQDKLDDFLGYPITFCQDNQSKSKFGVLRGLHYQIAPDPQTKLVTVIMGEVLDVAVDIRQGSPSFGQHVAVNLSAQNKRSLLVPRGFAHGFVVLSEWATISYKVDNYYNPKSDRGIAFNDHDLDIDWKIDPTSIIASDKDLQQPSFREADYFCFSKNLYL